VTGDRHEQTIARVWTESDVDAAAEAAMTGRLIDPEIMHRIGPNAPHDYLAALYERVHELVELETLVSDLPPRLVGILAVLGMSELSVDELSIHLAGMSDEDRVTLHWHGLLHGDRATELGARVCHVAALVELREH
jgi:hypothetical protein